VASCCTKIFGADDSMGVEMKLAAAALIALSFSSAATDYQCGLYQVSVDQLKSINVDSQKHGTYVSTDFDKHYNFLHVYSYGDKQAIVRETTHGRVAFRIPGESLWNACKEIKK
jgi:hypothetical protein